MSLEVGSKGDSVLELQKKLKDLGFDPGPTDGIFDDETRKALVEFQEKNKLEADGIGGPATLKALDIKIKLPTPEPERKQFRALLLENPNYFGNIKVSTFKMVKKIAADTSYEELKSIGYNPPLERLEAVVYIKREYGYGGGVCSSGTPEYVRFFVDWKNDGTWVNVGMADFTAYDIPGDKPLEYAVNIMLEPEKKFCKIENLPKVRAILSWNCPPPEEDPDFVPVWGNVLEARIQIDSLKFLPIGDFLKLLKVEPSKELVAAIDPSQPVQLLEPQKLSLSELKVMYKGTDVPEHRFGFSTVQKLLTTPHPTKILKPQYLGTLIEDIDISEVVKNLLITDGDTSYEELKCIGYNPDQSYLTGLLTVKLPYGYCGSLCTEGSTQFVAFWEWDEISKRWAYLGTAPVNVHDIKSIPPEGLQYSVFLPVDFSRHRQLCTSGAKKVRIRAILSWQEAPPPNNPSWIPTWGNREETLIQIKNGTSPDPDKKTPYIDSVGNMAVCDIDQNTGLATGEGVIAEFDANESPFGGEITITGFIDNAPKGVMEGIDEPVKYKVSVQNGASGSWQPLTNSFEVNVVEQKSGHLPVQRKITQENTDGYYEYLEDLHGSEWRIVTGRVLAKWRTGAPMSGKWNIKIETMYGGTPYPGKTIECKDGILRHPVTVCLDNNRPTAGITITGYRHGSDPNVQPAKPCGKFVVGDTIYGKCTATDDDKHFYYFRLGVLPSGSLPDSKQLSPKEWERQEGYGSGFLDYDWKLDTKNMKPCGYVVHIEVWDRTIVDSGRMGWHNTASVGFCLE